MGCPWGPQELDMPKGLTFSLSLSLLFTVINNPLDIASCKRDFYSHGQAIKTRSFCCLFLDRNYLQDS